MMKIMKGPQESEMKSIEETKDRPGKSPGLLIL